MARHKSVFQDPDRDQILRTGIGNSIRRVRRKRGLSQSQLGDMTGIPSGYISVIENGKKAVNFIYIFKIAAALQIPVDELLNGRLTEKEDGRYQPHMQKRNEMMDALLNELSQNEKEITYHTVMAIMGISRMFRGGMNGYDQNDSGLR